MDLSALTGMFVGVHAMLAQSTRTPELEISQAEGEQFLGAASNVLRHYSVSTTQKTLDWIAFAGIAGMMYGTRAIAIGARTRQERQGRASAPVVHLRPRMAAQTAPQPRQDAPQPGSQPPPSRGEPEQPAIVIPEPHYAGLSIEPDIGDGDEAS